MWPTLPTPADMLSPVRTQYQYNILYLKKTTCECQKALDWTNESLGSVLLLWQSVAKLSKVVVVGE